MTLLERIEALQIPLADKLRIAFAEGAREATWGIAEQKLAEWQEVKSICDSQPRY